MATRTEITGVQDVEIGAGRVAPTARRRTTRIVVIIAVTAVTLGAILASAGPSTQELQQAHWEAVVEHHRDRYESAQRAGVADATRWQQVVEHYETQWIQR